MELVKNLDQDREKILKSLTGVKNNEKIQKILNKELDLLMYRYLEEETSELPKRMAQGLFETAKASLGLTDCLGESEVWERKVKEDKSGKVKDARMFRIYALILICLGVILAVASYVMPLFQKGMKFSFANMLVLLLGALFLFLGGLTLKKPSNTAESELRVETYLDPEALFRELRTIVMVIEQTLSEAKDQDYFDQKEKKKKEAEAMDRGTIELFAGLLEASLSEDGDYALSETAKVKYYLHQRGIETVSYQEDKKQMFDMIQTGPEDPYETSLSGTKQEIITLRPAMVSGDKVLKKGLAGKR
ncbi:MAG: hypothetical protein IJM83_06665 [Firmicutes bacterium]|nr:hypothetical protein [Bacillota bacterium]